MILECKKHKLVWNESSWSKCPECNPRPVKTYVACENMSDEMYRKGLDAGLWGGKLDQKIVEVIRLRKL